MTERHHVRHTKHAQERVSGLTEQTTSTPSEGSAEGAVEVFLTHLRTIADIKAQSRPKREFHIWNSTEELLLSMAGQPVVVPSLTLADGMRRGRLKECFANALMASTVHPNLRYSEGFAMSGFFPVAHAWLTDAETGAIYDPTWINLDYEGPFLYLGMTFSKPFMAALVDETGDPSVFESDWRRKNRTAKKGLLLDQETGEVISWGAPHPF